MANANTIMGYQNLPSVAVASTAEFGYKVPAAGGYPSLPNPTQVAGNVLIFGPPLGDVNGGELDQGRSFIVKVNGVGNFAQSENVTISIYQVTAAAVATGFTSAAPSGATKIATTGTQATGGALKTSFYLETAVRWDSQSKILNGEQWGQFGTNAVLARAANTASVSALNYADLNFYVTFTCSVSTSDVIGPVDMTVERY